MAAGKRELTIDTRRKAAPRGSPQRPTSKTRLVIALDLGGTKLAAALVNRNGQVLKFASKPSDVSGRQPCLEQLIACARRAQQWARSQAVAIGVSVPGLVRRDGTVWAPNLPGWNRVPVARHLGRATGLPLVVDSDRNASVLGETWRGAARGASDAIYLIVGTGIGAGIVSGGRLVRGADELSGCAGWLAFSDHRLDSMGRDFRPRGVLESIAAGPAIAAAGAAALDRPAATTREVLAAARRGHPGAHRVVEQAALYLGLAVANLISLFNPQVVVLGGGVGASGETLLAPLRRTALRWAQPLAARRVKIVASRLGGRAPLLGMARIAWDSLGIGEDHR